MTDKAFRTPDPELIKATDKIIYQKKALMETIGQLGNGMLKILDENEKLKAFLKRLIAHQEKYHSSEHTSFYKEITIFLQQIGEKITNQESGIEY